MQVGAALVASEAIVAEVGAGLLGFLRYCIALIFLLTVMLARGASPVRFPDLLHIALLGIGQFGVLIVCLNLAVLYTSSARAALVFATLPLMTLAVGWILTRRQIVARELSAIGLTIFGIVALLGADALQGHVNRADLTGLVLAAVATLIVAVCSIFYRPYITTYGIVTVSTIAMAASLILLGAMALLEDAAQSPLDWSTTTYALIAFVGFSSGIGYLMWLYALGQASASTVTAFLSLSPITATVLSVAFLSAEITSGLVVALIAVTTGLVLMKEAR